jgi:hypothetical protein
MRRGHVRSQVSPSLCTDVRIEGVTRISCVYARATTPIMAIQVRIRTSVHHSSSSFLQPDADVGASLGPR